MLLWSPGDDDNPLHPGDNRKARQVIDGAEGLPLFACPTHSLQQLMAALEVTDGIICSDGGAMHLAAGLGKPIVCLFGRSDPRIWRPWGVPHVVLQPPSREATDIAVADVVAAYCTLDVTS